MSRQLGRNAAQKPERVWYSLYDKLLHLPLLCSAFYGVKRAQGAPGNDGQSIKVFEKELERNLNRLLLELREKSYLPQPVRRVEIPKPTGGTRLLGIPAVRDRIVQQALLFLMQPIFEPNFHPSSYGYRPARNCHQAIEKATMFIRDYNRKWVVDMDLSKCFDTLDHNLILKSVRRRITDGSILGLLEKMLKSGVMTQEGWQASETGSPQGGVISPLQANIYLDAFDQFMMKREHRIVRYADDILILCQSKSAAENALKQASDFLEGELKLTVNQPKTHLCHSAAGVHFLGVIIRSGYTQVQPAKIKLFKEKVKFITRRNNWLPVEEVIEKLSHVLRGWANYFRIANCKRLFSTLMAWIRRRIRAIQMKEWKKPGRLHRRLRQLGYKGEFKAIKMNSWRNAGCQLCHYALPNTYLHEELFLYDMCRVETGVAVLWSGNRQAA